MADSKISGLTAVTSLADADLFLLETAAGLSRKIVKSDLTREVGGVRDGWLPDTATWTYASGSGGGAATFTVPGDVRAQFPKGTRIKLTQTTVKYFVVTATSYSSPNTTVSIMAGTDYTLANAAITSPFYSYEASPQGFPAYFNFTPTYTGFSAAPTGGAQFSVIGAMCFFNHAAAGLGTSNATTMTISLPIACGTGEATCLGRGSTGGTESTLGPAYGYVTSGSTTLNCYLTPRLGGTTWGSSSTKGFEFVLTYWI